MKPDPSSPLIRHQRLLAEWICREEESAGHPGQSEEADRHAVQIGGSFSRRVLNRALYLDADGSRLREVTRTLAIGRAIALIVCVLAALAGAGAASAALGQDEVISVPLVLLALVGINWLSLLIWGLMQFGGARGNGAIAAIWAWAAKRLARNGASPGGVLNILTDGRTASWRLSTISHGAWLSYTAAGCLCLAALLSVRAYELDWQTTLLSEQALRSTAHALSWPHRMFGMPGPESLDMGLLMDASDRRGWARWTLIAVAFYGLLPRLLAWTLSFWQLRKAESRWAGDSSRPGLARLHARLMPERGEVQIVDADLQFRENSQALKPSGAIADLPAQGTARVAVDWPGATNAQGWLGLVEDSATRRQVGTLIRTDARQGLVIVVPATATPDRGMERTCQSLTAACAATSWLALADLTALRSRGAVLFSQRLDDWRALAARAGIQGGVGAWNADNATVDVIGVGSDE